MFCLVLVGHSIGCYMILEMMKREPGLKVLKAVMLFPTIERMAQSPQGKLMTPLLCQLRYLAYLPVFLLSLLPHSLAALLIRLLFSILVLFPAAVNSMYLGGQEMRMVLERDDVTIRRNLDRLIFYYGATDHWCPVSYFQDMRRDFPHGDIRLCDRGLRHAFVLDAGREVAQMVAEWIRSSHHHPPPSCFSAGMRPWSSPALWVSPSWFCPSWSNISAPRSRGVPEVWSFTLRQLGQLLRCSPPGNHLPPCRKVDSDGLEMTSDPSQGDGHQLQR
uniref:Lipid droplet-associated hydrolase n=1 Tax=Fundulus heteroclitus TaxID=8078 RepID=A0A3Q2PZN5_FUNHE